jgi:hypothetical protein
VGYFLRAEHAGGLSSCDGYPIVAFHIGKYRVQRTRFTSLHHQRFEMLSRISGFTVGLSPGDPQDTALRPFNNIYPDSPSMAVDLSKGAEVEWRLLCYLDCAYDGQGGRVNRVARGGWP